MEEVGDEQKKFGGPLGGEGEIPEHRHAHDPRHDLLEAALRGLHAPPTLMVVAFAAVVVVATAAYGSAVYTSGVRIHQLL